MNHNQYESADFVIQCSIRNYTNDCFLKYVMRSTSLPEIYLAFFVQSDGTPENQLYFKNRKLFRNFLNRFTIESTKVDIQFKGPVTLKFNLDKKKVTSRIHEHLEELKNKCCRKLENLHIFYFGRYWLELENNLNLEQLDKIADRVHLSALEMRKYGEILESDMLDFYSGNKNHQISLNDSLDEFFGLSMQTKAEHVPLRYKKMDFVKFGSFLAARNSKSNEAINIINEISLDHISRFDIGFIMGDRKIDITKEALDEIESQTGLVLERESRYHLYECFMKTSVVRYQKLNNGARSVFDSKRISRDSGIVEDGTEEEMYKIYQNPDFERQETYATIENIIKNPEMIKTCRITNNNRVRTKKVKINESKNEVYDVPVVREIPLTSYKIEDESSDNEYELPYAELPMDKYGSTWGSYYHDHPYIGRYETKDDNRYATTSFSNAPRRRVTLDDNDERAPFLLDKIRQRKKENRISFHGYTKPYADTNDRQDDLSIIDEDTYFDTYGGSSEIPPDTLSLIQRWSTAINRFFQRTKTLRNLKMFWQQILCTIFIILGKNLI